VEGNELATNGGSVTTAGGGWNEYWIYLPRTALVSAQIGRSQDGLGATPKVVGEMAIFRQQLERLA